MIDETSETAMPRSAVRDVHGVLLLDKPVGFTSNQALQRIKRLFGARKAGHTGSLDPLASGMLPVCLGQATKVSAFLLDANKHYIVSGRLGEKTSTGDAEGEVIASEAFQGITEKRLASVLDEFRGSIQQIPPMHSAIKHKGQPLYKLARRGIEIEREPREVQIHELTLLELGDEELTLEVRCSKGTYVRTLVESIAEAAGTYAHVASLRRLSVGPYGEGMHRLEDLEARSRSGQDELDEALLPIDSALQDWPAMSLPSDSAYFLLQGQAVTAPRNVPEGLVRLYTGEGPRFLGVGELQRDGRVKPKRLFPGLH